MATFRGKNWPDKVSKGKFVNVVVTGHLLLDRKLRKLPTALQKKLTKDAAKVAAKEVVLPDARRMVPVDTGELEKSMVVRVSKALKERDVNQLSLLHGIDKKKIVKQQIGASVYSHGGQQGSFFYGHFHEFGWDDKPEGDPYLRPALYGNQKQVFNVFKGAMKSFLREVSR